MPIYKKQIPLGSRCPRLTFIGVPKRSFSENFRPIDHELVVESGEKKEERRRNRGQTRILKPPVGQGFKNMREVWSSASRFICGFYGFIFDNRRGFHRPRRFFTVTQQTTADQLWFHRESLKLLTVCRFSQKNPSRYFTVVTK